MSSWCVVVAQRGRAGGSSFRQDAGSTPVPNTPRTHRISGKLKCCTTCGNERPLEEFLWRDKAHTILRGACLRCRGKCQTRWVSKNRERYLQIKRCLLKRRRQKFKQSIDQYKESTPCADCGNKYPAVCMDFDHRVPCEKRASISRLISNNGWQRVWTELTKCDLVCANCHRIRTAKVARADPGAFLRPRAVVANR